MTVVAALVERKGPSIMLARRAPGLRHAGLWELPGGKVEPGEGPGEALLRELAEELGVEARLGPEFGRFDSGMDGKSYRFIVFRVELPFEPRHLAAHDQVAWFGPGEIPYGSLAPLDLPILETWVAGS